MSTGGLVSLTVAGTQHGAVLQGITLLWTCISLLLQCTIEQCHVGFAIGFVSQCSEVANYGHSEGTLNDGWQSWYGKCLNMKKASY